MIFALILTNSLEKLASFPYNNRHRLFSIAKNGKKEQASLKTDIEIAQAAKMKPVVELAAELGIAPASIEQYGTYKAKIDYNLLTGREPRGKLVLVTAINPTPAGEGKTTVTVGLTDALNRLGKKSAAALREPSLGPVFGVKGGAAGGGYAQVVPMEDINLHFTGDIHAIGAANNLLAAMLDNHIYQGNSLRLDPKRIFWRRCVDMNDRQLRQIIGGLGASTNGRVREDGFDITVASEVMAILCLARDIDDLKKRLAHIVVGCDTDGNPVTAHDLHAEGAMAALLKDALKPNLVQTLEHSPAFIHGGPFANIAHGCNSVMATRMALSYADYAVTEAGFGADLGAEKFLDIKCRKAGVWPDAVVLVATIRALKYNGGAPRTALTQQDFQALEQGVCNLERHIQNLTQVYGLPVVVAINRFATDSKEEIALVQEKCQNLGVKAVSCQVFEQGGKGGEALAQEVVRLANGKSLPRYSYSLDLSIEEKIRQVAQRIYRAEDVAFLPPAKKQLAFLKEKGFDGLPVCIAKTQYSFSDDPTLLGAPTGYKLTVRDLKVSAGAGFVVAYAGNLLTMPGLPAKPAAEGIDVDSTGKITGLF